MVMPGDDVNFIKINYTNRYGEKLNFAIREMEKQ